MNYCVAKPSLLLSPYIKQYWAITDCLPANLTHTQRIVPCGTIELNFYLGSKPFSLHAERSIPEHSVVSGQLNGFYDIVVSGSLNMFSVTFHPFGALMFFNLPLNEFYNQTIALSQLLKDETHSVEDELSATSDFYKRITIIEKFLYLQLLKNNKPYIINRITDCINTIKNSGGMADIDQLASRACLSRKQFERHFNEYIGISPKTYLKIIRFQYSIYCKQLNPTTKLSNIAYDSGYFDQSHMINEYRKLSGKTPKEFFSECEPHSDFFSL